MDAEKLKPAAPWGRAQTIQIGQILLCGLFAGVFVRWLALTAPVLPVSATEARPTVKASSAARPLIPVETEEASTAVGDGAGVNGENRGK